MRLLSILIFGIIGTNIGTFAELSPSACSLLRTAASITTMVPEMAQIAMRYYRASSSVDLHHRQKRFIFGDNASKDTITPKGSVFEQMVANAFKDVNFTRVALLILNNNETMTKIRQNTDVDAILHAAMREIDYEKLGSSLWYNAEAEFDLEYIIGSIINVTHIDLVHDELVANGTLPAWLIKSLHPDINVQTVQRMINSLRNFTRQFAITMNSSQGLEEYLFNLAQKYALTPLGKIIQQVKNENPTTLDQLVEIILANLNKIVMEQFPTTTTKSPMGKKPSKNAPSSTTLATVEENPNEDVKLLLYQCSIAIQLIGHTVRDLFESFEELYCTTVWD